MPTTALDQHSGEWTVDDVLAADFPEHLRVECVDGAPLVSPRPDLWRRWVTAMITGS